MTKEHVIVLTKGASGSVYYAQLLRRNDFYFGSPYPKLNGKHEPEVWKFANQVGKLIKYKGNYEWDFDEILSSNPTQEFIDDLNLFLGDLNDDNNKDVAWKVPVALIAFDWLLKSIKDVKIIVNIRDPRDFVYDDNGALGRGFFRRSNVQCENISNDQISSASWKCAYDYV